MDRSLWSRLAEIETLFEETETALADPEVHVDPARLAELGKRHSDLRDVVTDIRRLRQATADLEVAREMADDTDMARLADDLTAEIEALEESIKTELVPKDSSDARDVILEIRSAAGGDEAAIWAGDLLRMYEHYADRKGFRIEAMDTSPSEAGGYDKVTVAVKGKDAFSRLKYEAG
ncbi:MAG TPA: PCRF domain-containing protein, partial [Acidimicrobiia bacterium]